MSSPAAVIRRKPRLMIVEDEPDLRVLIQFAAKRAEVFSTICTAEDGRAALELVRAGLRGARSDLPPDVIITDWNMPRMSGIELAAELRRSPETREIAVALFTAAESSNDREQASLSGCCAHFTKPAGLLELTAILKSLPTFCTTKARRARVEAAVAREERIAQARDVSAAAGVS